MHDDLLLGLTLIFAWASGWACCLWYMKGLQLR